MQSRSKQTQEGAWRLVVPGGRAPVDLAEGTHILGASLDSTLLIGVPWGRVGARLDVASASLRISPSDEAMVVLLDGERLTGVRALRPDGSSHSLSIGDVTLHLSAPGAPDTKAVVVADSAPPDKAARRGVQAGIVTAVLSLAAVLFVLTGASASRLPVNDPAVSGAAAQPILSAGIQAGVPGLKMQTDEQAVQVATGVLRTREACARMDRVRHDLGVGAFIDRTVCLPGLQDHAREWLAGTGLTVEADGDRLLVRGSAADDTRAEAARRAVEALRDALPGVRIESTIDMRVAVAPPRARAADPRTARIEQARALIAGTRGVMISETGGAVVLLEDGRMVRVGELVTLGVKLAQVDARSVVVESGGRRATVDLPHSTQ